jgi:hypothetical protein
MLRKAYTIEKVLGMMKSVLPETAQVLAENVLSTKLAKPAFH